MDTASIRKQLLSGLVIPAHPLALTAERRLDERRQRALTRYYMEAGAGGVAVGVHTTQFAIREVGLLEPVLELAAEELGKAGNARTGVGVAGICGGTPQALTEARLAADLGYQAGLLSLTALRHATAAELIDHARAVAEVIPVFGFYLQPAVGGRLLPYAFWREFFGIPNVVAVKIAPFNRYQTLDVLRALAASGRAREIALYTGNDDSIVIDLLTAFRFGAGDEPLRFQGGLLGHWAVWTRRAVELHQRLRTETLTAEHLTLAAQVTDMNAALFDAAHGFHGCIAGVHEVLRRQGLLEGRWCLDAGEDMSPGQAGEIDRVTRAYPEMVDDQFVRENRDRWLRP